MGAIQLPLDVVKDASHDVHVLGYDCPEQEEQVTLQVPME